MADESGKGGLPSDEDIKARFEKIRADLKGMDLPELPEDEGLRAKIEQVTHSTSSYKMPEPPEIKFNKPKGPSTNGTPGNYNYKSLGIGMSAAYSLIGSMMVGFGLGFLIDRVAHTNYCQMIGALLGSVLGIVMAIFLINRDGGTGK